MRRKTLYSEVAHHPQVILETMEQVQHQPGQDAQRCKNGLVPIQLTVRADRFSGNESFRTIGAPSAQSVRAVSITLRADKDFSP